jgi:competence ComEA-like helix-hairpin-helix protein
VESSPRDGAVRAASLLVALAACVSLARTELAREPAPQSTARPASAIAPSSKPSDGLRERGKIDLNTADEGTLTLLPRVGPALARRIRAHREARGPFASVDALVEVKGIGPKTLELIRPMVEVSKTIPEVGEADAGREREVPRLVEAAEGQVEQANLRADEQRARQEHVE